MRTDSRRGGEHPVDVALALGVIALGSHDGEPLSPPAGSE
jgi:hypothetical protein